MHSDIACVIVSFNSSKFLEPLIKSLLDQTLPFKEIVLVDNNSQDGSKETICSFPEIHRIFLEENLGYAAAANIGINSVSADIVLLANADICLDRHFCFQAAKILNKHPDTGLLSPLIMRFDRQTVDSAGQECSCALYPKERGFGKPVHPDWLHEQPVFSVCGAATIIRQSILKEIYTDQGPYDNDFFMFWEDFDLGWRAQNAGIPVLFSPDILAFHYRSGSLKKGFLAKISLALARPGNIKFHLVKNRYLVLIKNFRLARNFKNIPCLIGRDLIWVGLLTLFSPKIIIRLLGSGKLFKRALDKRKKLKLNE